MLWFFYLLALAAGLGLTAQAGVNTQLRHAIGDPLTASLLSFLVGTLTLLVFVLSAGATVPSWSALGQLSWWKWTGGLIGAGYVTAVILVAPRIGAANMVALIVAAQLVSAVVFDHYGWLGFPVHPANLWRIAGGLLIIGGVYLILKH
jgi:bacterial/archaeal transporter family-2 protein